MGVIIKGVIIKGVIIKGVIIAPTTVLLLFCLVIRYSFSYTVATRDITTKYTVMLKLCGIETVYRSHQQ